MFVNNIHPQTSNKRHTLAGNKIVDCSDVVGASAVGTAPTTLMIFIPDLALGFNGLGKYDCRVRRETFQFGCLVTLILKVLRYVHICACVYDKDLKQNYQRNRANAPRFIYDVLADKKSSSPSEYSMVCIL